VTTMIVVVGDASSDQVAAVMRIATEINVAGEEERLRERQQLARDLVDGYRRRPARRARPGCTPKSPQPVRLLPAYREELAAFAQPDWSGDILEYPAMPDKQPATPWGGVNGKC
jgi:hypothetical protein